MKWLTQVHLENWQLKIERNLLYVMFFNSAFYFYIIYVIPV